MTSILAIASLKVNGTDLQILALCKEKSATFFYNFPPRHLIATLCKWKTVEMWLLVLYILQVNYGKKSCENNTYILLLWMKFQYCLFCKKNSFFKIIYWFLSFFPTFSRQHLSAVCQPIGRVLFYVI